MPPPSSNGAPVSPPPYANATLSTRDGSKRSASISADDDDDGPSSILVNVYLPPGIGTAASSTTGADTNAQNNPDLPYFYRGSRFEWGSMIGPIVVTKSSTGEKELAPDPPPWHLRRSCWKLEVPVQPRVHRRHQQREWGEEAWPRRGGQKEEEEEEEEEKGSGPNRRSRNARPLRQRPVEDRCTSRARSRLARERGQPGGRVRVRRRRGRLRPHSR